MSQLSTAASGAASRQDPPDSPGAAVPRFWRSPVGESLLSALVALSVALFLLQLICIFYGQAPATVLAQLWQGTWGTAYGIGQVLFKSTPLLFTGLSVALAFRAGLFNLGGEGQAVLGALMMGMVGTWLPPDLPAIVVVPLCLMAGATAGGLWGALPGLLKVRFGAHEVITSIMLNFVAMALSSYLVVTFWAVPETVHTPPIIAAAQLPRLDQLVASMKGAPVNGGLLVGLAVAGLVNYLLFRTTFGYQLRVLGLSRGASTYAGTHAGRLTITAFIGAGALAGLVGSNFVLGYKHYHEEGFSSGVGFLGIAVALLGQSHPVGVLLAALLFGTLSQGGLAINALIPKDSMDILQAVIILSVAAMSRTSLTRRDT